MLVCVVVELTSTTGDSPLTVTVSWSVPTRELDVEARRLRDLDAHALALQRREPGQLVGHGVDAGRQTGRTGRRRSRRWGRARAADQRRARGRDGHAGQHGPLRVADDAGQRAGLLRKGRCRQRAKNDDHENETMERGCHVGILARQLNVYVGRLYPRRGRNARPAVGQPGRRLGRSGRGWDERGLGVGRVRAGGWVGRVGLWQVE